MASVLFENNLDPGMLHLEGEVEIREQKTPWPAPAGSGNYPSTEPRSIIHADQAVSFEFAWKATGMFFALNPNVHWHYGIHFERIGGGSGIEFPSQSMGTPNGPLLQDGKIQISLPSGFFAPSGTPTQGQHIYKVVATVLLHNFNAQVALVAGYCDLGYIQVYDD